MKNGKPPNHEEIVQGLIKTICLIQSQQTLTEKEHDFIQETVNKLQTVLDSGILKSF